MLFFLVNGKLGYGQDRVKLSASMNNYVFMERGNVHSNRHFEITNTIRVKSLKLEWRPGLI